MDSKSFNTNLYKLFMANICDWKDKTEVDETSRQLVTQTDPVKVSQKDLLDAFNLDPVMGDE